jgi:hypothetical protein
MVDKEQSLVNLLCMMEFDLMNLSRCIEDMRHSIRTIKQKYNKEGCHACEVSKAETTHSHS